VVLVATDPQRMARPLLAKGGPAERRAHAAAGIPATVPPEQRPPRGYQLTPAQQRAMRRNMHMARPGYRVRRLALLCATAGVIHATPGHEGSTRTCPKCEAVEAKTLDQRVHDCPRCGLVMPRDRASALVMLGWALLEFRDGPDPQGRIAERRATLAESLRKAAGLRERRAKGGRRTGEARRQRAPVSDQSAGASPAGDASASSLQGVVPLRPEQSGRNIGANMAASGDRNSN
jgi:transposase